MERIRQIAYRRPIYWAMLDLRVVHSDSDPARRLRYSAAVADWLHNLAEFSSRDFEGFDEAFFWELWTQVEKAFPDFVPGFAYRKNFEWELTTLNQKAAGPRPPPSGSEAPPGALLRSGAGEIKWTAKRTTNSWPAALI